MKFAAITCFLTSMGLENAFLRSMDLSFWSVNLCSFIATASKNHVEMSLGRPSLELIKESARLGLALDWKNAWKKTERIERIVHGCTRWNTGKTWQWAVPGGRRETLEGHRPGRCPTGDMTLHAMAETKTVEVLCLLCFDMFRHNHNIITTSFTATWQSWQSWQTLETYWNPNMSTCIFAWSHFFGALGTLGVVALWNFKDLPHIQNDLCLKKHRYWRYLTILIQFPSVSQSLKFLTLHGLHTSYSGNRSALRTLRGDHFREFQDGWLGTSDRHSGVEWPRDEKITNENRMMNAWWTHDECMESSWKSGEARQGGPCWRAATRWSFCRFLSTISIYDLCSDSIPFANSASIWEILGT